jgi:hypothetical protein
VNAGEFAPHFIDYRTIIGLIEYSGAGDKRIGSRRSDLGDITRSHTAIDLKANI